MEWAKEHLIEVCLLLISAVGAWFTLRNKVEEGNKDVREIKDEFKEVVKLINEELKSIDKKVDDLNIFMARSGELDSYVKGRLDKTDEEILMMRKRIHDLIDTHIGPMQLKILLLEKKVNGDK